MNGQPAVLFVALSQQVSRGSGGPVPHPTILAISGSEDEATAAVRGATDRDDAYTRVLTTSYWIIEFHVELGVSLPALVEGRGPDRNSSSGDGAPGAVFDHVPVERSEPRRVLAFRLPKEVCHELWQRRRG